MRDVFSNKRTEKSYDAIFLGMTSKTKQQDTRVNDNNTVWKVSKYGVISGPYFPVFGLNTERFTP